MCANLQGTSFFRNSLRLSYIEGQQGNIAVQCVVCCSCIQIDLIVGTRFQITVATVGCSLVNAVGFVITQILYNCSAGTPGQVAVVQIHINDGFVFIIDNQRTDLLELSILFIRGVINIFQIIAIVILLVAQRLVDTDTVDVDLAVSLADIGCIQGYAVLAVGKILNLDDGNFVSVAALAFGDHRNTLVLKF